ncbi:MAG: type I-E CRISPR-associated protein Cas6/Cse3/CasE [Oscillospiraceae bacterium]|jgi:CRISPR system Cascade subunit CasE|nr:type I-E CRISPR-associated protein Cas6/Cse3/CasE [Oscillospiraceae bacterium]
MYLSRVEFNFDARSRNARAAMRALGSPQIIHAVIEGAMPPYTGDKPRSLWRVDELGEHTYLLLLSRDKPDLTRFVEQFGYDGGGWETRDYAPFLERLADGQRWRFRLQANPTKSAGRERGAARERGDVVPLIASQFDAWLTKAASRNGFTVSDARFTERGVMEFGRDGRTVTINTARFEGILTIEDVGAFRAAMTNGIGRGKAYGCGLLTLARP